MENRKLGTELTVSALGLGCMGMTYAYGSADEAQSVATLEKAVDLGVTFFDTAEMYGDGAAEELVGFSIQGMDRSKLFLVSKVYPFNAGQRHIFTSCEDSLRRMKTDYLDLYLLHWRGSIPLRETVECMEELKAKWIFEQGGFSKAMIVPTPMVSYRGSFNSGDSWPAEQ